MRFHLLFPVASRLSSFTFVDRTALKKYSIPDSDCLLLCKSDLLIIYYDRKLEWEKGHHSQLVLYCNCWRIANWGSTEV